MYAIRSYYAERKGGRYVLRGTKLFVPDASSADFVLVVARLAESCGIFLVPRDADSLVVTPMHAIDSYNFV